MGILSDAWGWVQDNSDLIGTVINAGATAFGDSQQDEAQNKALSIYRQGAKKAAKSLTKAEEAALEDTLSALNTQRKISESQLSELESIYSDIASNFGESVTGAADTFATKAGDIGSQFASTLDQSSDDFGQTARGVGSEFANTLSQEAQQFGGQTDQVAGQFSGRIGQAASQYGNQTQDVAGSLANRLGNISNQFGSRMGQVAQNYQPYAEGGDQALAELERIAARDPGTFTPEQKQQEEEFLREARANLAASGLRGAGRAGVATMNEGLADLHANFYNQNQARQDQALQELSNMGFQATGAQAGLGREVARTGMDLSRQGASAMADAGERAAQAIRQADVRGAEAQFNTGLNAADRAYQAGVQGAQMEADTALQAANTNFAADQAGAQAVMDTNLSGANRVFDAQNAAAQMAAQQAGNEAQATQSYYNQLAGLAGAEGQARAGAERAIGGYEAAAESNPAFMEAQGKLASGQRSAQTFGKLGNVFANFGKELASQNDTDAAQSSDVFSDSRVQPPNLNF